MSSEQMGVVSRHLRGIFALVTVLFVAVLAISPVKDYFSEWKRFQRDYVRYAQTRSDTKALLASFHPGIDQIWIPEMKVVDRCATCHIGISDPKLQDSSVPQPFRAHSPIPHSVKDWGCVICHRGQGVATEVTEAHQTTLGWEQPLLSVRYIQASCGTCHKEDLPQTPRLNRGRELLAKLNCAACHRIDGVEKPAMFGPDLANVGDKVSREWIYKWLNEPQTITDASGNVTVDGYAADPRMPHFALKPSEISALSAYLSSLKSETVETHDFSRGVLATLKNKPDVVADGEIRFQQVFCTTCHSLAVTRAGVTEVIGGDIGPELTKIGTKVNENWLIGWLRNPQQSQPHSSMPRYGWSEEDLYKVIRYMTTSLTDPDLLKDVPQLPPIASQEVRIGKRLFLEKGCASCHTARAVPRQKDFGPELLDIGAKNLSQLAFGSATIPHTLVAYLEAKITDPHSVNPAARMPQYYLSARDLDAIITALLSMKGAPDIPATLIVPKGHTELQLAGAFGKVYERYKCYACHQFNGYGGRLAPDLSFEGSRAQRAWIVEFLKNPRTLRPILTFRMPQFNVTDAEAATIADYFKLVAQSPQVDATAEKQTETGAGLAIKGKELYEVKYQCQACHTIQGSGGYVGPDLSDAGNWLTSAWIAEWLKNPQALIPGTLEPRRSFTPEEVDALAAYLVTLKQRPQPVKTASAIRESKR
jgi:mono/diheme cytochrome c family protein